MFSFQKYPWAIVGYTPRDYKTNNDSDEISYYIPSPGQDYSMVLTGAAFVHREFLRMYTKSLKPEVRELVSNLFNCEDIAMNYMVSDFCRCGGTYFVQGPKIVNLGVDSKGLWNRPGHGKKRDLCTNAFRKYYGYMPLRRKPWTCAWKLQSFNRNGSIIAAHHIMFVHAWHMYAIRDIPRMSY